ncbi:sugar phosphate isomerase/epimerase family protein [Ruegeria sp.]|uniref:sugar phosphate isomerase/epimerase family protein n=1 Tax=Ruegeria sp. TaxID=1879320 RepID=UPI003C79F387
MRVSAQLYTVRQVGPLEDQLRLVKTCGFEDIETIGFHDLPPQAMIDQILQSGLNVRSAHFDWEEFETRFDDILGFLEGVNCRVAVMPWLAAEQRPRALKEWAEMAGQLAEWAKRLAERDVQLAYHNHDFDLEGDPGNTPLDQILAHENIFWQPDIGWLAVSMPEPVALLRRYADRIVSVHAKDADPDGGLGDERWRDLGQGVVDWEQTLDVLSGSRCTDLFVEHDESSDQALTLKTGRDVLTTMLSEGVR